MAGGTCGVWGKVSCQQGAERRRVSSRSGQAPTSKRDRGWKEEWGGHSQ